VSEVVYVLGTPGSNTVKIGRTTNLAKRLGDIQRMSPVPLSVLWQCPGGHELETNLHRHFANLRSHGEWFTFRVDAVPLIQWAVEDEPWHRKKISLKKAPQKVRQSIPAPRIPLRQMEHKLDPNLQQLYDDVIQSIAGIPDLVEQYRETERTRVILKQEFSRIRQEAVLELKQEGRSWREVGEIIGVSGARAEQISRGAR
jgi:hypothetical protein